MAEVPADPGVGDTVRLPVPWSALTALAAERDRLAAQLAAVRALCFREGFTTWDQDARLGDPPWSGSALSDWERVHGHDPRLKCYPEFGCQLLIDPEDVLAASPEETP